MTDGVYFACSEDKIAELHCSVCDEKMDVKRNVDGPTSSAEAMAKGSHLHDVFLCPFRNEMWHRQICKLTEEAVKCPSKRLADIMIAEADGVLKSRQATKEVTRF